MNWTAYILGFIITVLVFLPPKWDPAIRIKEWQLRRGQHPETPSCFGSAPGGQAQAENGCWDCPIRMSCQDHMPWRR